MVDPFSTEHHPHGRLAVRPFEPAAPSIVWAFWSNRRPISDTARRFLGEMRLAFVASRSPLRP